MTKKQEVSIPSYRKIAIDIAKDIVDGKYKKGQRLFGRSVLASQYGVSPETIRKAVYLLKDMGILETQKGSGIKVISVEKAQEFIKRHKEIESISTLKNDIFDMAQAQSEQNKKMLEKILNVVSFAERLHTVSPLNPYQIKITSNCRYIGETVGEVQFWHHTGGTIIAIRRNGRLILSPGPYATFCDGDIFLIIGDEASYSATIHMLYG